MMTTLNDKVILVTGTFRRTGSAMVRHQAPAGINIIINHANGGQEAKLILTYGALSTGPSRVQPYECRSYKRQPIASLTTGLAVTG